jgi:3-deoxy-D-manno-octulosonic-acid transferase
LEKGLLKCLTWKTPYYSCKLDKLLVVRLRRVDDLKEAPLTGQLVAISVYYFLLSILLLVAGPILLLKKKARAGLSQKLGFITAALKEKSKTAATKPRIWFHAVSVGEFNALFPLLTEFRKRHPQFEIFISTTTATGQEIAKSKAAGFAEVFYFPFDLPWITAAYLDLIAPSMVAIVETEIWPGFINQCHERNIPCMIVNGRLSPRSSKGYKRWGFFFGQFLAKLSAIAVQTQQEQERFAAIGNKPLNISVCGNIKLDGLNPISSLERKQLREKLNLKDSDFVLVAGSTHEGEESALLEIAKRQDCKLILVPRHPERFDRVQQIIEAAGLRARRFTENESFESASDVYLLDTIGQLSRFYSVASLAFVGGTLANVGGHNLAEPCMYKVPVLCGPHVHKAKDFFDKLSERGALHQGNDVEELNKLVESFKSCEKDRIQAGESGYQFIQDSQGAVARTLSVLEQYLPQCDSADRSNQKWERVGVR